MSIRLLVNLGLAMFYTIYKITNKINNKEYIGKHQTKDVNDGYMGSGKQLIRSIKKYGIENFSKEILFILDSENEMNRKEAELVTEDYCNRKDTYNICPGGQGGWGYINSNGINLTEKHLISAKQNLRKGTEKFLELMKDNEWRENFSQTIKDTHCSKKENYVNPFEGKHHSDTFIENLKGHKKQSGEKNSQYGTCWITNGEENKKIKKTSIIPNGWYKGRTILG
jgi:hypothetical protein